MAQALLAEQVRAFEDNEAQRVERLRRSEAVLERMESHVSSIIAATAVPMWDEPTSAVQCTRVLRLELNVHEVHPVRSETHVCALM